MESKDILEVLKQVNENNTYKKVFINGAWGVGKSYYTNQYIEKHKDNFVYVTLFGKINYDSIEEELAKELMKKLVGLKKGRKVIKSFLKKVSGSFSYNGFSINTPQLARKGLISEYSSLLDSKSLVIVIDDLERKSGNILIEDIMGMIEEFSMFEKTKIVIIGDEKNIFNEDLEKWIKFKEKIIEKEYLIQKFSDESINNLVRKEIMTYVIEDEIEDFVNTFIKKHKIQNLRTIIKGINLFKEINNNYIEEKSNKKTNLMLLKNCMSVAIECTDNIYKPTEEAEEKDSFQYIIDKDISSRIIHHYFGPIYVSNNDSCALEYVLEIFNCDFNQNVIDSLNNVIKNYLDVKNDEKSIFYLSEDQISKKIYEVYECMINETYKFISIDKFIEDTYEVVNWREILKLDFEIESLKNKFNEILFHNFYSSKNSIRENIIDSFEFKRAESPYIRELIDNYNKEAKFKYLDDQFSNIKESYDNMEYNLVLLEWLDMRLIQEDKQIIMEKFVYNCRENNFFIPKIDNEINEDTWRWIQKIWKLFFERMNKEYKSELNEFAESLKTNNLSSYRICLLQKYSPLVEKESNN